MTVSVFDYEAELLACAAGDQAAFHALYHHESPAMRALALAMLGAPEQADEVLHETFILIWRNASGYSPAIGTARAWIYSILRYRALERLRRCRLAGDTDAENLPLPALNLQSGLVQTALSQLPGPQRDALLQAYLHGGDPARIAARLDRTEPDIQASIEAGLSHIDAAVHA
ncbi:sigma factor [Castellaniella hirudinis]|uniref:sigma factor n=1 Tax=Castellaniella hirudinis TaxID=1144617 RepID=UPI0039C29E9C